VIFIILSFRRSKSAEANGNNPFHSITRKIRPESIRQHRAGVFQQGRFSFQRLYGKENSSSFQANFAIVIFALPPEAA